MTSKYIAASHSFQEQSWMQKPELPSHDFGDLCKVDYDVYNCEVSRYNEIKAGLRLIPCRPGDKWQEGILYEEGEDYTVVTFTPSDCQPSFFVPPDDLPIELMIIPFPSLSSEPPTTEQTQLWKEFLAEAAKRLYAIDAETISEHTAIVQLSEKYALTRKEEVPEAVEFAEWAKRNDWLFDPEVGNWFHADDKEMSGAELYAEFQLFKNHPGK